MNRIFIEQAKKSIGISWDDDSFNEYLSYLYKPWQVDTAHPSDIIDITRNGDNYVINNGQNSVTSSSFEESLVIIEYFVTAFLQEYLHTYLQIHSCTVSYNGKAVSIVGDHGTGKTTLACAALHAGMKALCDDVTVIANDFKTLIGFPRPFKITDDTWTMKPSIIPDDAPSIKTSGDIYMFFHEPPGKYYTSTSKIQHIIFMTRRHGETMFLKIGEMDALRRLLPQGFNFYRKKDTLLEELHLLFHNAPPIELLYSNHLDAAHEIKCLLE